MLTLTVTETYNENNMVEITMDGENLGQREMNKLELAASIEDAKAGRLNVLFDTDVTIEHVLLEEYDGEYDVSICKYTYGKFESTFKEYDFDDEFVQTYKREKSAYKKMVQVANERGCGYEVANC